MRRSPFPARFNLVPLVCVVAALGFVFSTVFCLTGEAMGSRGISDFEESGETVNWNVLRSAPPLAIDGSRVAPGRADWNPRQGN